MRKPWGLLLALALLLQLSACGGRGEAPQGEYLLYFLSAEDGGPALAAEPWSLPKGTQADPEVLLEALLAGPASEGLSSPFPRGTSLRGWSWDTETEGNLQVRLSEQYSGLTDVSLTLADYAIVLTLGQLEGVASVEVTAAGLSTSYRSHQILVPEEAVLDEPLSADGSPESGTAGPNFPLDKSFAAH